MEEKSVDVVWKMTSVWMSREGVGGHSKKLDKVRRGPCPDNGEVS